MIETSREYDEINSYFEPISQDYLEHLKDNLAKQLNIEHISELPVKAVKPGDYLFDFHEAQNKIYMHAGSFENYKNLLIKYGLSYPFETNNVKNIKELRNLAKKESIILDGTMPGFAYNIGGEFIMYPAIKDSEILNMANKYQSKEGLNRNFDNNIEARTFLMELAEKYFYHEVGHFVYMHLLKPSDLEIWDKAVMENSEIISKVIEVQKDKHPNPESIPVFNEAFADFFGEYSNPDNYENRLGKWPKYVDLVAQLIKNIR